MRALFASFLCLSFSVLFFTGCDYLQKFTGKTARPAPTPPVTAMPSPIAERKIENPPAAVDRSTPIAGIKTFYDAVAKEQFDVAWNSLTKKSQDKFITMVAGDEKMDLAKVRSLFEENQMPIRLGFWRSFRNSSKIDVFAPVATYKVISENGDQAEVELVSGTVTLKSKAMKEDGQWKLGYVETFMPDDGTKPEK